MKNTLLALWLLSLLPAGATLTAQWGLSEGSGTTTTESVHNTASADFGTGIDWTATTPVASTSMTSFSLQFTNTSGSFVNTQVNGSTMNLVGTGAKTFVAWINTTSTQNDGILTYSPGNGSVAGGDLRLALNATTGVLRFEVSSGATVGTIAVNTGDWYLVAAVVPANATIADVSFYVGAADLGPSSFASGTPTNSQAINTLASGAGPNNLYLGNYGNNTNMAYEGLINRAWVFDEALTQGQLDALRVPEPSAALLGGLGILSLLRRRKA